jgi:hypothetical protein
MAHDFSLFYIALKIPNVYPTSYPTGIGGCSMGVIRLVVENYHRFPSNSEVKIGVNGLTHN